MRILKYIFIGIALLAAFSCGETKKVMEPEEVVEAFCRAVAAGDFDAACALCDTTSMNGYLENYRETMDSLQKKDSSALMIASSLLAGAEFEVIGTEKNGDERAITYRLAAEGNAKSRKATVKKEEGEWKVTAITDTI